MSSTIADVKLRRGDRLDQPTFHQRYAAMGEGVRAELVQGVVHRPSPAKSKHGRPYYALTGWLVLYQSETIAVTGTIDTTTILAGENEVQPDCALFVAPEHGGRVRVNEADYLEGAPEFVGEVSSSSACYDLHGKKDAYQSAGVLEYVVVAVRQKRVIWHRLVNGRFVEADTDKDGVFRSKVFLGLWLDPDALLKNDTRRLLDVLRLGIDSPEHAEFVQRLADVNSGDLPSH
ncbi:MAG: Uma2 family endonuclease [Planctomycetota bacterium]|nr:Uma2 family endonuclease [Planctomycetota bacterium]